ncbi:MAG: response regulator [Bacteroidetes bacterium]|nr:response regulator [Bacteroidota bacterium]
MKILIVEDDIVSNKLLTAVLEGDGHEVVKAYNGVEGYKALGNKTSPELIISDVQLPLIDGYTLLSMVRGSLSYYSIPFILYTAKSVSRSQEVLAYELGASVYLKHSPRSTREIVIAVNAILADKS